MSSTSTSTSSSTSTLIFTCGVDEAGRGPLAGPVFAAAVILNPDRPIAGLADSKKLTEAKRTALFPIIQRDALAWAIAQASVAEIDQLNILQASLLAMRRAVALLSVVPTDALVDGNRDPRLVTAAGLAIRTQTIVQGDASEPAISAASILAKVARDALMVALHNDYPEYGWAGHKGYPSPSHLAALKAHGASPHHRQSFAPVRAVLAHPDLFGQR